MSIISKMFKIFTNDGIDLFDETISDFSFKEYFDQHIDEVRKKVLSEDYIKENSLHFCFVVAHRLYLREIKPYESIVESCKYCSNNPDCDTSTDFRNVEKTVRKILNKSGLHRRKE